MRTVAMVMFVALERIGSTTVILEPGNGGVTPAALVERYDVSTVHERGFVGRNTRIAVVAASEVSIADVVAFRTEHGLPAASVDRVAVPGPVATGDPTTTLLLEWAGALAPGAGLTAVVGDPWSGLASAILENVAPIIVVADIATSAPPQGTVPLLVRVLYERGLIDVTQVAVGIPGEVVAEILFAVAAGNGQTIIVPADSAIAGRRGVVVAGGTEIRNGVEVAWPASMPSAPAHVAALASPDAPGYVHRWQGSSRCCAGGDDLAAAVWGGVAAILRDAGPDSRDVQAFIHDAGVRMAEGGIASFNDVTEGVPSAAPGFDFSTGFGTPRVAGLVAALDCANVDCVEPGFQGCRRSVCVEGGICKQVALADGTPCSADACTVDATCQAGRCTGGSPLSCEDDATCTADSCDPDRGCIHAPRDAGSCRVVGGSQCLEWLVEAGRTASPRVVCRDGDPACDRDGVPGQCTFVTALCLAPGCASHPVRIVQPPAGAVRARLSLALRSSPEPGQCTEAAGVVVRAGRSVKVRARAGRRTGTVWFVCRAG